MHKLYSLLRLLISFIIVSYSFYGNSQSKWTTLDSYLVNGKEYNQFQFNFSDGHQYLVGKDFRLGVFYIKGQAYEASLNYDIYINKLVVQYLNSYGFVSAVTLPNELIDSFIIDNRNFVFKNIEGKDMLWEVVGELGCPIYIGYHKTRDIEVSFSNANYYFSDVFRVYYWANHGNWNRFTTKNQLVKQLKPDQRKDLRRFLRKMRFKMKTADRITLQKLSNYLLNNCK